MARRKNPSLSELGLFAAGAAAVYFVLRGSQNKEKVVGVEPPQVEPVPPSTPPGSLPGGEPPAPPVEQPPVVVLEDKNPPQIAPTVNKTPLGNVKISSAGPFALIVADGRPLALRVPSAPAAATYPMPLRPITLQLRYQNGMVSDKVTVTPELGVVKEVVIKAPEGAELPNKEAVAILDAAKLLIRQRRYDEAVVAYTKLIDTYPGTPQASAALILRGMLLQQLKTAAGKAALDRANPL